MGQFVGYAISQDGNEKTPISVGSTRDEAMELAITRTLSAGLGDGEIGVQEKPDLSPDKFERLRTIQNEFWSKREIK